MKETGTREKGKGQEYVENYRSCIHRGGRTYRVSFKGQWRRGREKSHASPLDSLCLSASVYPGERPCQQTGGWCAAVGVFMRL